MDSIDHTKTFFLLSIGNVKLFGNTLFSWVIAILVANLVQMLWTSSLTMVYSAFQQLESPRSEMEEQIRLLVKEILLIGDTPSSLFYVVDRFILYYVASLGLKRSAVVSLLTLTMFKVAVAIRLGAIVWELFEIFCTTQFLGTAWAHRHEVGLAEMRLYISYVRPIVVFIFLLGIGNDALVTLGFDTNIVAYCCLVGAGVMGSASSALIGDFVASVQLLFDQPFSPGDAIAIDGCSTVVTVKSISFKYTRLQVCSCWFSPSPVLSLCLPRVLSV